MVYGLVSYHQEDTLAGTKDIKAEAEKLNLEFFGGKLDLDFPMRYGRLSRSYGQALGIRKSNHQTATGIVITNIYTLNDELFRKILCHELIHTKLMQDQNQETDGHGRTFRAEVMRIREAGLDVPLSEDLPVIEVDTKKFLTTEVFFIAYRPDFALFFRDYEKADLDRYCDGMRSRYGRQLNGDDAFKLYWGETTEPFVRMYPVGRTLATVMKVRAGVKLSSEHFEKLKTSASDEIIITKNKWEFAI